MADSVEEVVNEYLNADLIFAANFEGIYWMEAPATVEHPYVVYWQVDDPGTKTYIATEYAGDARLQFSIWDTSKVRGVRLRTEMRKKMESLNEIRSGYTLYTTGVVENTLQRTDATEPYQFVVDAIIRWRQ